MNAKPWKAVIAGAVAPKKQGTAHRDTSAAACGAPSRDISFGNTLPVVDALRDAAGRGMARDFDRKVA